MIAVKTEGRLGNQLFQYAFIYNVSKKIKTRFYIDISVHDFLLPQYFDIETGHTFLADNLFKIQGYKNFFNIHLRRWFYNLQQGLYHLKDAWVNLEAEPIVVLNNITDSTIYNGYFQSPLFFIDNQEALLKQFQVKLKYQEEFQKKYNLLYSNHKIACVHIRRTDYLNLSVLNLGSEDLSIPLSYYKKAIEAIADNGIHFVFISDDPGYVARNFSYINNKTISTDSEIMDFQLMLNANYCIIANSTFSWWSAWLNTNPYKKIYAPQCFMGHLLGKTWPPYIYPANWIIISTNG